MSYVNPVWTDQVDFRPMPYQPPRPSAMKVSLITAAAVFGLGLPIIFGSIARLPDIDPNADPGLVVDYAAQPPADRGLLVVAPAQEVPLMAALSQAPAPQVTVQPVAAKVTGPDASGLADHLAYTADNFRLDDVHGRFTAEEVMIEPLDSYVPDEVEMAYLEGEAPYQIIAEDEYILPPEDYGG